MRSAILAVGILPFVVGSIGSFLLDINKRRNRPVDARRHYGRHERGRPYGGGPYYGSETGRGDDGRDQGRDD
jgi:hypothetical protein